MPDTETLTEEQLKEIEAHLERLTAPGEPWESKTEKADTLQNVAARHVPALCGSLRAARAEIERQRAVHDQGVRRLREMEADRDRERVRANLEQSVKEEAQANVAALRTQNQTQRESITTLQENEKSLKAQLAQAAERLKAQEDRNTIRIDGTL